MKFATAVIYRTDGNLRLEVGAVHAETQAEAEDETRKNFYIWHGGAELIDFKVWDPDQFG